MLYNNDFTGITHAQYQMNLFKALKADQKSQPIFQQRLRFHIEQETSLWRQLKSRFQSRRIDRHLKSAVLVCISKLDRSDLPHFKYTPQTSQQHFPVLLINADATISSIMHLIREETGISPKTGLSVLQNGKLLVPGTKLHELRLEYGEIVFLSYTQSEVF